MIGKIAVTHTNRFNCRTTFFCVCVCEWFHVMLVIVESATITKWSYDIAIVSLYCLDVVKKTW